MKTTLIILTILFLQSCCTKKECDYNLKPFLIVQLKNFDSDELLYSSVSSFDLVTKSLVNVEEFSESNAEIRLSSQGQKELRDQFFVIDTPVSSDTIYNVAYELYTYKTENCNKCFPLGAKKLTVTTFRNFSYFYKGQQYFKDTFTIEK
jgi:hypothetical protein